MTSLDIRNNSAVMKRAEQLKRWEESDTNQQPPVPRPERGGRIKFSSGCIFLAACLAGDKEEVLKMLEQGADINTANVDGLTALHQACIDDNLEMVEFLVEQGADINRQDNEGWTPLHATASCGFVSIARYLVEHGADVSAVNSDGDLAVDLAVDIQHLPMIDFMQKMVAEQQIDCAKARQAEEQLMLSDAKKWLRSDASEVDRPHPKTGATALHVAAAKGYTKVLSLLLAGRANVDAKDNDGWTPLHAAAHWGQKEAAEMLLDAMADMDLPNYAGQTCIDVADRKMVKFLEEYRASNKRMKRRPSSQISRISDTIENHIDKTPTKIIRVEVRPENNKDSVNDDKSSMQKTTNETPATEDEAPWRRNNVTRVRPTNESPIKNQVPDNEVNKTNNATTESDVILRRTQSFENDEKFYQKYNELRARIKANSCPIIPATLQQHQQQQQQQHHQQQQNNNVNNNNNNNNNNTLINNSTSTSSTGSGSSSCMKNVNNSTATTTITTQSSISITNATTTTPAISSTNTHSTNNSLLSQQLPLLPPKPTLPANTTNTLDKFTNSTNSPSATATTTAISTPNNITNFISPNYTVQRSASLKDHKQVFIRKSPPISPSVTSLPATSVSTTTNTSSPAAVATPIRRSFVPPVRDEESETQRKAHAKRVRETRRSTQGVTLDEIKSAEELVKKKNSTMNNNNNNNNNSSSFKLEDATSGNTYPPNNSTIIPSAPAVIAAANSMSQRRINSSNNTISSSNQSLNSIGRPVSAPPTSNLSNNTTTSSNTSTSSSQSNNDDKLNDNSSSNSGFGSSYSSRRSNVTTSTTSLIPDSQSTGTCTSNAVNTSTTNLHSNNDDKDNDKENDNRSALATQAVILRRRKPKRRSTGVVHIDMDELDPEKQDSANDNEEKESGSESRPSRSRVGSTASTVSVSTSTSATDDKKTRDKTENSGDNIDYKALWEAVKLENEKLKQQLKKKDDEVVQTRATLERFANATTKNSLSEIEKRERRAMERKLSELEEELKQLDAYKAENLRLKEENGALIRVISKLSK